MRGHEFAHDSSCSASGLRRCATASGLLGKFSGRILQRMIFRGSSVGRPRWFTSPMTRMALFGNEQSAVFVVFSFMQRICTEPSGVFERDHGVGLPLFFDSPFAPPQSIADAVLAAIRQLRELSRVRQRVFFKIGATASAMAGDVKTEQFLSCASSSCCGHSGRLLMASAWAGRLFLQRAEERALSLLPVSGRCSRPRARVRSICRAQRRAGLAQAIARAGLG